MAKPNTGNGYSSRLSTTSHTGLKTQQTDKITNYALFLGGLNATHQSLEQYNPLITSYARIFFVKMPKFLEKLDPNKTKVFKHILEYGFTKIGGISGISLDTDTLSGGYTGNGFEIPTSTKDDTNGFSVTVYEFSGSPVTEYLNLWITGMRDQYTGVATYHGAMDPVIMGENNTVDYSQANHVAEAFFVVTDPTGLPGNIEYCCLLTNIFPKGSPRDHFNFDAGSHNIVTVDIDFSAVKYESAQINEVGKMLLQRFPIQTDFIGFQTEYNRDTINKIQIPELKNWRLGTPNADGTSTGYAGLGLKVPEGAPNDGKGTPNR